eukprot:780651-Rhodomonas_salina.1
MLLLSPPFPCPHALAPLPSLRYRPSSPGVEAGIGTMRRGEVSEFTLSGPLPRAAKSTASDHMPGTNCAGTHLISARTHLPCRGVRYCPRLRPYRPTHPAEYWKRNVLRLQCYASAMMLRGCPTPAYAISGPESGYAPRPARIRSAWGSGFGVQGSGFTFQGSGFRVRLAGLRVQGSHSKLRVQGSGFSARRVAHREQP